MGLFDDQVRIKLAGQEIPIRERYTVRSGILEVPAKWEIQLGHGGMLAELCATYPKETPFELFIGDKLVQVGETDERAVPSLGSNTLTLTGRDSLKRLHDTEFQDERTFAQKSYTELTKLALQDVGLGDRVLLAVNSANRTAITGKEAKEIEKKTTIDLTAVGANVGTATFDATVKGEIGSTWLELLVKEYRKAGLFLWSDHSGNFILSAPNGAQNPLYRIVNRRGSQVNEVSIVGRSFRDSMIPRFSEFVVCGRAGRGKYGRVPILARFFDDEVIEALNPNPADRANGGKRKKPRMIHDHHAETPEQAKFIARRMCAESRRNGFELRYTVPGHSAPAIGGGRAVWQPDTTVEVIDDDLGIEGIMYVESVTFSQAPMVTELHLMRIDDLVFAEEAPAAMKKRPKLQTRRGVTTVARVVDSTPGGPAVWIADPNKAIGAPVQIDPDNEDNLTQTADVTLKPLTQNDSVGVIHDDPADIPKKPTP